LPSGAQGFTAKPRKPSAAGSPPAAAGVFDTVAVADGWDMKKPSGWLAARQRRRGRNVPPEVVHVGAVTNPLAAGLFASRQTLTARLTTLPL
jgi:hypothetical protein